MPQSGTDIAVDYRTSQASDCELGPWTEWQPLADPGAAPRRSKNGVNAAEVGSPETRCFQYRARLTTSDIEVTPSLLNLSIKLVIPGNPDLKVSKLEDMRAEGEKTFTGLDIEILNKNEDGEDTVEVYQVNSGSFYVDLCVLPEGTTMPSDFSAVPVNLGQEPPACVRTYAVVNSRFMGIDATYTLRRWYHNRTDNDHLLDSLKDMEVFFPEPGVYTVVVAVDSTNFVPELSASGEMNNVSTLDVVVYPKDQPDWQPGDPVEEEWEPDNDFPEGPLESDPIIYLPLIAR
jgi:hypothetical protein